jgi:hypothetical protein
MPRLGGVEEGEKSEKRKTESASASRWRLCELAWVTECGGELNIHAVYTIGELCLCLLCISLFNHE